MATYAIGDVHGCYRTLVALLDRLPLDRRRDRLWLVGDLVNRGPRSLAVLRWARGLAAELGERMVVVLGNHDVHLLALAAGLGRPHHRRHLADVLDAADGEELVAWLRHRPLLHREAVAGREHLLVHAGLLPRWTPAAAAAGARRAEALLRRSDGLQRLLGLGGGGGDEEKEREAFRVLTRLRMLTADGRLCGHTGPPEEGPAECVAWFDAPERRSRQVVAVAGHWAALGRRLRPDLVALDSGCVYGGELTAVRLEDREVFVEPNREARV